MSPIKKDFFSSPRFFMSLCLLSRTHAGVRRAPLAAILEKSRYKSHVSARRIGSFFLDVAAADSM